MRIVSSVAKTSYALSWLIVGLWIDVLLLTAGSALPFLSLAFSLAALIVGVRTFRGAEEPVGPPRAWWRATATTRSSIVMSAIFFAAGVLQLSALITSPWNEHNPFVNVYVAIAVFLAAAFFAHSAWRQFSSVSRPYSRRASHCARGSSSRSR